MFSLVNKQEVSRFYMLLKEKHVSVYQLGNLYQQFINNVMFTPNIFLDFFDAILFPKPLNLQPLIATRIF